jgi:hypothetical protein
MAVCDLCGAVSVEPDDAGKEPKDDRAESLPLTWSTAVDNGNRRTYCAGCSRAHVRSMEAKLDSEWW